MARGVKTGSTFAWIGVLATASVFVCIAVDGISRSVWQRADLAIPELARDRIEREFGWENWTATFLEEGTLESLYSDDGQRDFQAAYPDKLWIWRIQNHDLLWLFTGYSVVQVGANKGENGVSWSVLPYYKHGELVPPMLSLVVYYSVCKDEC